MGSWQDSHPKLRDLLPMATHDFNSASWTVIFWNNSSNTVHSKPATAVTSWTSPFCTSNGSNTFHAAAPALKPPANFSPSCSMWNRWQQCSWPCLHATKPLWAQLHPELGEGSDAREMPAPWTLVKREGDIPVVIQAESRRRPLLVAQGARRTLCTCSLQNWNTEADIFMTFIIFPVSSMYHEAETGPAPVTHMQRDRAACSGRSQHVKALLLILWHHEHPLTYKQHLTYFFSYRLCSIFPWWLESNSWGHTHAYIPFSFSPVL